MTTFTVGLDLGQASDYTALSVITADGARQESGPQMHIVTLARERGTPYTAISARTAKLLATPPLSGGCTLVVDATGVGLAVLDLLRAVGLQPVPVTITGGDKTTYEDGGYRVPKRDVVAAVQVALQQGTLKLADGLALGPVFLQEMLAYRLKISATGHDSYENWRADSEHDDLVLSVALAVWHQVQIGQQVPLSAVKQPEQPSRFYGTVATGPSRWR